VDYYYRIVERELKDAGLWEKTVAKFPPKAIRAAVKHILEALDSVGVLDAADELDWGAMFEKLWEFKNIGSFIEHLRTEYPIPRKREVETVSKIKKEEERVRDILDSLSYQVAYVEPEEVRRDLEKSIKAIEEVFERYLKSLESQRKRILRKAKYEQRIAMLEKQVEELKRYKEMAEKMIPKVKEAKPPPPPPKPKRVRWTRELERKLRDIFEAALIREGISPRRYLPEFRLELETIRTLETEDEMIKAVEELAKEIIEREKARRKPRPPPPITEHPSLSRLDLERLWNEFLKHASRLGVTRPQRYGAEFARILDGVITYDEALERVVRLAEELASRPPRITWGVPREIQRILERVVEEYMRPPFPKFEEWIRRRYNMYMSDFIRLDDRTKDRIYREYLEERKRYVGLE